MSEATITQLGRKLDMDDLFEELEDVSRVQELDKVKDQAIALFGRSKPPGQDQKQDKTKAKDKDKTKKKCHECKKPGHIEKDCWIKHPELKPEKFKNRGTKRKADESSDEPDAKRAHVHVP